MKKIFDCVLFNGEFEILKLRMEIMSPYVHEFLVIEAGETFSGIKKDAVFENHINEFKPFLSKINYKFISSFPSNEDPWAKEHYLRDQIRFLVNASNDDLIIVADTDELINLPVILKKLNNNFSPATIKLSTYYYFVNCKSSEIINATLIAKFGDIKNRFIGNRDMFNQISERVIEDSYGENGAHLTYQFGYDISKYIQKIQSFSHQEFNNKYFLNNNRIKKCINYNLDIFERDYFRYVLVNINHMNSEFYNPIVLFGKRLNLIQNKSIKISVIKFFDQYYLKFYLIEINKKIKYFKRKFLAA